MFNDLIDLLLFAECLFGYFCFVLFSLLFYFLVVPRHYESEYLGSVLFMHLTMLSLALMLLNVWFWAPIV